MKFNCVKHAEKVKPRKIELDHFQRCLLIYTVYKWLNKRQSVERFLLTIQSKRFTITIKQIDKEILGKFTIKISIIKKNN